MEEKEISKQLDALIRNTDRIATALERIAQSVTGVNHEKKERELPEPKSDTGIDMEKIDKAIDTAFNVRSKKL